MEFMVVAQSDLTRAGARIVTVLERAHDVTLLTPEQLAGRDAPGPGVGVILLGEFPSADEARGDIPAAWEAHGVRVGYAGNRAFVHGSAVNDPDATLKAINAQVADLTETAEVEVLAIDSNDPQALRGIHLAGLYLDPYLPVPAETVVARKIDFSPARMCWERQYTLGIGQFLARAFDPWVAELQAG